jgi:hypothetical protein
MKTSKKNNNTSISAFEPFYKDKIGPVYKDKQSDHKSTLKPYESNSKHKHSEHGKIDFKIVQKCIELQPRPSSKTKSR